MHIKELFVTQFISVPGLAITVGFLFFYIFNKLDLSSIYESRRYHFSRLLQFKLLTPVYPHI